MLSISRGFEGMNCIPLINLIYIFVFNHLINNPSTFTLLFKKQYLPADMIGCVLVVKITCEPFNKFLF